MISSVVEWYPSHFLILGRLAPKLPPRLGRLGANCGGLTKPRSAATEPVAPENACLDDVERGVAATFRPSLLFLRNLFPHNDFLLGAVEIDWYATIGTLESP